MLYFRVWHLAESKLVDLVGYKQQKPGEPDMNKLRKFVRGVVTTCHMRSDIISIVIIRVQPPEITKA